MCTQCGEVYFEGEEVDSIQEVMMRKLESSEEKESLCSEAGSTVIALDFGRRILKERWQWIDTMRWSRGRVMLWDCEK